LFSEDLLGLNASHLLGGFGEKTTNLLRTRERDLRARKREKCYLLISGKSRACGELKKLGTILLCIQLKRIKSKGMRPPAENISKCVV
jgi:hypothetical protein